MNANILVETDGLSREEWLRYRKQGIGGSDDAVEWVDAYFEASVEEDNAKAKKQDAANHIKEFMGDYDKAKCYDHSISWKKVTSEKLDTKALKENEPELYQKYVKSSTSRRFTLR